MVDNAGGRSASGFVKNFVARLNASTGTADSSYRAPGRKPGNIPRTKSELVPTSVAGTHYQRRQSAEDGDNEHASDAEKEIAEGQNVDVPSPAPRRKSSSGSAVFDEVFPPSPSLRHAPPSPRPTSASPRPTSASPRPVAASPRPVAASPRPAAASPRPVSASPRPVAPSPRPTRSSPHPSTSLLHGRSPSPKLDAGTVSPGPSPQPAPPRSPGLVRVPSVFRRGSPSPKHVSPASKPISTVPVEPSSTVFVKPSSTVSVKPSSTVSVKPSPTVSVKPSSTDSVKPSSTDSVKPSSTVSVEPSSSVPGPPSSTVSSQPSSTVSSQPSSTVSVKPSSTVPGPPSSTVPAPPSSTVSSKPSSTVPGQPSSTVPGQPSSTVPGQPSSIAPASSHASTTTNTSQVPSDDHSSHEEVANDDHCPSPRTFGRKNAKSSNGEDDKGRLASFQKSVRKTSQHVGNSIRSHGGFVKNFVAKLNAAPETDDVEEPSKDTAQGSTSSAPGRQETSYHPRLAGEYSESPTTAASTATAISSVGLTTAAAHSSSPQEDVNLPAAPSQSSITSAPSRAPVRGPTSDSSSSVTSKPITKSGGASVLSSSPAPASKSSAASAPTQGSESSKVSGAVAAAESSGVSSVEAPVFESSSAPMPAAVRESSTASAPVSESSQVPGSSPKPARSSPSNTSPGVGRVPQAPLTKPPSDTALAVSSPSQGSSTISEPASVENATTVKAPTVDTGIWPSLTSGSEFAAPPVRRRRNFEGEMEPEGSGLESQGRVQCIGFNDVVTVIEDDVCGSEHLYAYKFNW